MKWVVAVVLALVLAAAAGTIEVRADVDCGGGASCPDDNTCCPNGAGGYGCCPTRHATCCSDDVHCCPPEYPVCDETSGQCKAAEDSASVSMVAGISWLKKQPATYAPEVEMA
eukprot:g2559.t1